MKASSSRTWVGFGLRAVLAGVYLVAGGMKVYDPARFAESVANYRILPLQWVNIAAITLPWIEITAALGLLAGWWLRSNAWLINTMTLLFIAAISSAVARGLNIDCGCFGTIAGRKVGVRAITEDLLLLGVGLAIAWIYRDRSTRPVQKVDLETQTPK